MHIAGSFRVKSTKILRIGPGHLSDLAKINLIFCVWPQLWSPVKTVVNEQELYPCLRVTTMYRCLHNTDMQYEASVIIHHIFRGVWKSIFVLSAE